MQLDQLPLWGKLAIAAMICVGCAALAYGVLLLLGIA